MFPRVTHPSATPVLLRAFDLHVLSLPPAFVLSQDQTLTLNEILVPTGHFSAQKVGRCILDEFQTHPPQKKSAARPPHDGPARLPSKRDEFLKRDRQLSLRTSISGSVPSSRPELNPTTEVPQGPRRPRLSFFRCDCQTARRLGPPRTKAKP
jgi:hypothetical protein